MPREYAGELLPAHGMAACLARGRRAVPGQVLHLSGRGWYGDDQCS